MRDMFISHACEKLAGLSVEVMHDFVHAEMVPALLKQRQKETKNYDMTEKDILKENGLHTICPRTVANWMNRLKFKFSPRRKTYYVDGHEAPDTVQYRKKYILKYIEDEFRCFRWIQLSEEEVKILEDKDGQFSRKMGYEYNNDNGQPFFEFHVDDHDSFQQRCNIETVFGRHLSIRKPQHLKPIIKIGQDESVFKQYLQTLNQWYLPDGTTVINPKTDGDGIMYSAFVSREFGFGHPLTAQELDRINQYREGQQYLDVEAAMNVSKHNDPTKPKLTESPFVKNFDYGSNQDGYWCYDTMILQLEDVVDCLRVLYGDRYEFVFFFDHSSGHDKLRPDGLNVNGMNKGFGGTQSIMRDSKIVDETYLGPHSPLLQVGDVQSMVFCEGDAGPFWMSEEKQNETKNDFVSSDIEIKAYTKKELVGKLGEVPTIDRCSLQGLGVKELQTMAQNHNIPIRFEQRKMKEGWMGKAKGMIQILYERGFIDTATQTKEQAFSFYQVQGKKDANGNRILHTSLKHLITNLPDFKNESTLLQYCATQLLTRIECSPKYHPEIAGEGIEYCWGMAKNTYRSYPLSEKGNRSKFRRSVIKCMSDAVITKDRVRLFGRRKRRYMLAYLGLEKAKESMHIHGNDGNGNENRGESMELPEGIHFPEMSCSLVERIVKVFSKHHRSHRNIFDQDSEFIDSVAGWMRKSASNGGMLDRGGRCLST